MLLDECSCFVKCPVFICKIAESSESKSHPTVVISLATGLIRCHYLMPISCHFRDCKTSPKKVVKVKERFSCVARWNFTKVTKLEVKAVKLSFKDIPVFYFRISKKLPSFCTKTVDRQAAVGKLLFCPVKFNIGHGTEKFRRLFQSDRHTSRAAVWH